MSSIYQCHSHGHTNELSDNNTIIPMGMCLDIDFNPNKPHQIVTSGNYDCNIKIWDLRMNSTYDRNRQSGGGNYNSYSDHNHENIINIISGHSHWYVHICIPISISCLLYTSPSPRDQRGSRMPSSA